MSKSKPTDRPLTLKQKRFVVAIADPSTKSQAEAARKAGYSKKIAYEIGSQNVRKPKISKAVEIQRKQETDKARGPLVSIDRLLRQSLKALETVADGPMDTVTAGAIADLAAKLQRGQLEIAERYPDAMGNGNDKDSLRREARSIQLVMLHVLEAAIERPVVANRMLRRLRAQFAIEEPEIEEQENEEPPAATEGRWKPGAREDDAWMEE